MKHKPLYSNNLLSKIFIIYDDKVFRVRIKGRALKYD